MLGKIPVFRTLSAISLIMLLGALSSHSNAGTSARCVHCHKSNGGPHTELLSQSVDCNTPLMGALSFRRSRVPGVVQKLLGFFRSNIDRQFNYIPAGDIPDMLVNLPSPIWFDAALDNIALLVEYTNGKGLSIPINELLETLDARKEAYAANKYCGSSNLTEQKICGKMIALDVFRQTKDYLSQFQRLSMPNLEFFSDFKNSFCEKIPIDLWNCEAQKQLFLDTKNWISGFFTFAQENAADSTLTWKERLLPTEYRLKSKGIVSGLQKGSVQLTPTTNGYSARITLLELYSQGILIAEPTDTRFLPNHPFPQGIAWKIQKNLQNSNRN